MSKNLLRFEWDPEKGQKNRNKHGVSFEEASTVFFDEEAVLIDDPDHSDEEERFILIGLSESGRLLVIFIVTGKTIQSFV